MSSRLEHARPPEQLEQRARRARATQVGVFRGDREVSPYRGRALGEPGTGPGWRVERQPALAAMLPFSARTGTMSEANEMPELTDKTSEAEDDARTGDEQAAINRERDPPA